MRMSYTYRAINNAHRPTQSEEHTDLEQAITWAAEAADATGYHSTISATATEHPDAEHGDRVLDRHTNVLGAVRPGSREVISRSDSRYPQS